MSRTFSQKLSRVISPVRQKGPGTRAKRGVGVGETCGPRLNPSPCSIILPVSLSFNPQEDDAIF